MAQWHAQVGGQQYGPISEEEMKAWFAQGRVKATDYVWSDGMANWVTAGSVFGQSPQAGQANSTAQSSVTNPPAQTVYVTSASLSKAPGAVASMVCGIISCVPAMWCFSVPGLVLGIVAIMQAKAARAAFAANPGQYGGEGMTTAGYVMGIIGTVLGALVALYWLAYITCLGSILGGFGSALRHGIH